ncbi:MAG: hypothetical protein V1708_02775 [Candidatus Micrarchaeota archaeon]
MEKSAYTVIVIPEAKRLAEKLDQPVLERIDKKIKQLQRELPARHLGHGLPYSIAEAGQYRIAFKTDEATKTKTVYFIGPHKEYEKWLKS